MPYIHFTEEQKRRAGEVDLEQFLLRQGEKLLPSGHEKRLSSDRSVTVRGNYWYDHAEEKGGGPVSFLQKFYGVSYVEAVTRLLDGERGMAHERANPDRQREGKPFTLPPASPTMRRMYAYMLRHRGIRREVLDTFVRAKLVYESAEPFADGSKEYHNCVFVGNDEHAVARHAHKHGLYTQGESFKRNVAGCDPRYSFHHVGGSDRLYVFEAPVDLLSFVSIYPFGWQQHSYVALCGTSSHAMLWMLEQNPRLRQVGLCLDNDAAGIKAAGRLLEILRERGYDRAAQMLPTRKDWNEELVSGPEAPANELTQKIL